MKTKVMVIIFVIVLVLPMLSWPLVSLIDLPTVEENREKAPFPQFGDDVFAQFDEYFADRAPYRDLLIKLYNNVARKLGMLYESMLYNDDGDDVYTAINNALFGQDDWLFYTGDNSLGYYKGTNIPTERELRAYVARAEKVNAYFKAQGKQFVIFIAPNKEQIYPEYMPRGISVKHAVKREDVIYDYFKEHSDVTVLYPKAQILDAKKTYITYYQQDTHWNKYGGWIGANCIFDALNVTPGNVTITQTTHSGGDLANMATLSPSVYTAYDVVYRTEISIKFNVSNLYESEITSSNENGRHLLLLGDSFREAMIEVLAKEFETSILNHRDTFTAERTYEEQFANATTVIFQAVERYDGSIFDDYGILQKFIDMYGL